MQTEQRKGGFVLISYKCGRFGVANATGEEIYTGSYKECRKYLLRVGSF